MSHPVSSTDIVVNLHHDKLTLYAQVYLSTVGNGLIMVVVAATQYSLSSHFYYSIIDPERMKG